MLMYTNTVRMADYWIASRSETDIEREAWSVREPIEPFACRVREECRFALQEIDRLILDGTLEDVRGKIVQRLPEYSQTRFHLTPEKKRIVERASDAFENFAAGLKSQDPAQRARFERFREAVGIDNMSLSEAFPFVEPLEKAKRAGGRPSLTLPWENHQREMAEMRRLLSEGQSIPEAARSVAEAEGRAERASRAKRFERLFRRKLSLRGGI